MDFLTLPERTTKPRNSGTTIVIDTGLPTGIFSDILESHGHLIDMIKFGWCTAVVSRNFKRKLEVARSHGIEAFLGGTFFEKALSQNKLNEYRNLLHSLKLSYVEISNGTIDLSNQKKAQLIMELSSEFKVISEVGYKDEPRSEALTAADWIEFIQEDLSAGATKVITEARESGKSGLCQSNGKPRYDVIDEILHSSIDETKLVFEAPNKDLQVYFIQKLGTNVNLANIPFHDLVPLETLRLGLRSDTLTHF